MRFLKIHKNVNDWNKKFQIRRLHYITRRVKYLIWAGFG